MLTRKGATVTNPLHIANIFNDYFSSVKEKTKVNIKFSNKSLFIPSTDAHEVNLIISSLNSNKSTASNSLPT